MSFTTSSRRNEKPSAKLFPKLSPNKSKRLLHSCLVRNDGFVYKGILLLCLILGANCTIQAQQTPLFSTYYFNKFLINPAFTGIDNEYRFFGVFRSQWADIPGRPITGVVTVEGSFWKDRIGAGISVVNDQIGIFNQTVISGAYAQKIRFAQHHQISVGVQGSAFINQIDFNSALATDFNDPSLEGQERIKTVFDLNAGIGYQWKGLLIGFSVPHILTAKATFENAAGQSATYGYVRYYNAFAQYRISLLNEKFNITPSVVMRKGESTDFQFDGMLMLDYNNLVFAGAGYRNSFGVIAMGGFNIADMFTVAYAYDFTMDKTLKGQVGGTHEIVVGFHLPSDFKKKKKQADALDPSTMDSVLVNLEKANDSLAHRLNSVENKLDSLLAVWKPTGKTKEDLETLAEQLFLSESTQTGDTTQPQSFRLDKIYFDKNQDTLTAASNEQLDLLVNFMEQFPQVEIMVNGYADSTGIPELNLLLSENRARAVVWYLTKRGISRDRLSYKGHGEQNPIADNTTLEGQKLNRRVEFIITKW